MISGGISNQGKTDLYVQQAVTMTVLRYSQDILRPDIRPYTDDIGPGFILMEDNNRIHRARIVDKYLDDEVFSSSKSDMKSGTWDDGPLRSLAGVSQY